MTDAPFFPLLFQAPAKFVLEEAIASVSTGWSRVQNTLAGRGAEADAALAVAVVLSQIILAAGIGECGCRVDVVWMVLLARVGVI